MFTFNSINITTGCLFILLTAIAKSQNVCHDSQDGCLTCWDLYNCQLCMAGWYKTTDITDICKQCSIGCSSCSSSSSCSTCYPGFFITSSACSCPKGKGIDSATRTCKICELVNCATCNTNYQSCTSCIDSYGYDSATSTCMPCTVNRCTKCPNDPTVCTSCIAGYATASSSSCNTCSYFMSYCLTCSSNSQCLSCSAGYGVYSSYCDACSFYIDRCLQCSTNVYRCTKCQDGYGLKIQPTSTNIICQVCSISNCQLCGDDYKVCNQCLSGFTLQPQGYCTNCSVANCIDCGGNPSQCQSCYTGYGVINPSKDCVKCVQPNCQICSTNYNNCQACLPGFGLSAGSCIGCSKPNCLQCPTNYNYCTACPSGYGPFAGDCNLCWSTCLTCFTYDWKCTTCKDGYGLSTTSQFCDVCAMFQCATCPNDYLNTCTSCKSGYGIDGSGKCVACTNDLCFTCSSDASACTACVNGYGASGGSCVTCSGSNCVACPSDPNICTQCSQGFGVSSGNCIPCQKTGCRICSKDAAYCQLCHRTFMLSSGSCLACIEPHCEICTSGCQKCLPGYGLDSGQCQPCSHIHCQLCPLSPSSCELCVAPWAADAGSCVPCQTGCLTCHPINYIKCFSCIQGYYLQNQACIICQNLCIQCSSGTVCEVCQDGYYANLAGSCIVCPLYCYTCDLYSEFNPVTSSMDESPNCLTCDPLSEPSNNLPAQCLQICGDEITQVYPCDTPNGIPYDGCTDYCEVQDNFTCNSTTICSFTGILDMKISSVSLQRFDNKLKLKVDIFPPLYVFKQSPQDLIKVFKSSDPDLEFTSITFDETTNQLIFEGDFKADLLNRSFQILFYPAGSTNPRYELSIEQQANLTFEFKNSTLPYYYTPMSFVAAKAILYLSYMLVALRWIAVILGVFARRMAGLEAMFVLQFSWINIVWLNSSYLYTQFQSVQVLKFSTFFNIPLLTEESPPMFSFSPPFTTQFSLSLNYFINNFNLCLILQFIPLCYLTVVFLKIQYERFKNRHDAEFEKDKPSYFKQLELHREYAFQGVMYFTMFNLNYFIACSVLYFQKGSLNNTTNLVFFAVCAALFLFMFIKFVVDPDTFGYLRYSFRYTEKSCFYELSFKHYLVYSAVLVLTVLLTTLLPALTFVPLVVLVLFFVFTLVYHPYKEHRENYRSAFNIFVMACMVGIKVYIQYYPQPFHNSLGLNLMLILNFSLLLPICVIVGLVSVIYYIIYVLYIRPKLLENDQQYKADREKGKVYEMIDMTDVNAKMRDLHLREEQNILKRITKSKQTLAEYSNQLFQQTIQSQREFFKDSTLRRPINLVVETTLKPSMLSPHSQEKKLKLKSQFTPSLNEENNLNKTKKGISKEIQLTSIQKTAKQILKEENVHINLKSTFDKFSQGIQLKYQKHQDNFAQAYGEIKEQQFQKSQ